MKKVNHICGWCDSGIVNLLPDSSLLPVILHGSGDSWESLFMGRLRASFTRFTGLLAHKKYRWTGDFSTPLRCGRNDGKAPACTAMLHCRKLTEFRTMVYPSYRQFFRVA